jgi:hypothetical protein
MQECVAAVVKMRPTEFEHETQLPEGTARYSDTKMASVILAAGYGGNGRHEGDPAFSSWRGMRSYLDEKLPRQIEDSGSRTLDTLSKYYVFGALAQSHLGSSFSMADTATQ